MFCLLNAVLSFFALKEIRQNSDRHNLSKMNVLFFEKYERRNVQVYAAGLCQLQILFLNIKLTIFVLASLTKSVICQYTL